MFLKSEHIRLTKGYQGDILAVSSHFSCHCLETALSPWYVEQFYVHLGMGHFLVMSEF